MGRTATGLALAILLTSSSTSTRADDPPPSDFPLPLEGPSSTPTPTPSPIAEPVALPAAIRPVPAVVPARAESKPVLALPGVTAPRPSAVTLPPPSLAPSADGGLPPLDLPPLDAAPARPSPTATAPSASARFRGRVIESTPGDDALFPVSPPPKPAASASISPLPTRPVPRRPLDPAGVEEFGGAGGIDDLRHVEDPKDADPFREKAATTPPRRPAFFGRYNPFAPRGGTGDLGDSIRAEPRPDPAADAALKRRVEKQAREAVGEKVKAIDVRVAGRVVTIQAKGVKLFQKRAVRRSLEGLPGMLGYRSVVEMVD